MRTDSRKNEILFKYLKILCESYSTGRFESLFPHLSDECVFESQWVLTPNTGKAAVIDYFTNKGATLRRTGSCPECTVVELVGNLNMIKNADVHLNGGESHRGSVGLLYPDGKLAMLMCQQSNGELISVLVDLQLNENDLISRIDLCMPELFNFKHYAGPFDIEEGEPLAQETIEQIVRDLLIASPEDFDELDEFVEEHEDDHPDGLADYVFRLAIQMGNTAYVEEHADEFDLNDGDGYSTYLNETDDEEMQEVLMSHGAFRSWDDYDDCKFAMETVNGEVLAFDDDFQREAFEKYKKEFNLTDERLREILADGIYDDESGRDVDDDLSTLGVSFDEDTVVFDDKCGGDGYALMELLEELGWDCSFEGDSWKLETIGVYFIR